MAVERTRAVRGFTLLELLVAIGLLALVVTLGFSALRLGTFGLDRAEAAQTELEELRLWQGFVRERIAEALPIVAERDRGTLAFAGRSDRLELTTVFPAGIERAGIRRLQLEVGRGRSGGAFVALDAPWADRAVAPTSVPIVSDVVAARFAYFGQRGEERAPRWHDEWLDQADLPRLVRVTIERRPGRRAWPPLIVAPLRDRETR